MISRSGFLKATLGALALPFLPKIEGGYVRKTIPDDGQLMYSSFTGGSATVTDWVFYPDSNIHVRFSDSCATSCTVANCGCNGWYVG